MNRIASVIGQRLRDRFDGDVSPLPYDVFRIGTAALVLVRTTDVGRSVVALYHHGWVRGWEYDPRIEHVVAPDLESPLLPGLHLHDGWAGSLVVLRLLLACALLLGIRVRITAGALALVGFALLLTDRFRYLHHIHLLWLMVAWIAFAPSPHAGIERLFMRDRPAAAVPRWPLQLWRLQAFSVYWAAGLAKFNGNWMTGKTLRELASVGAIGGTAWDRTIAVIGFAGSSAAIVTIELALPLLLACRRTRLAGVLVGIAFHLVVATSMNVSIFGAQMILFLMLFLPYREVRPSVLREQRATSVVRDDPASVAIALSLAPARPLVSSRPAKPPQSS